MRDLVEIATAHLNEIAPGVQYEWDDGALVIWRRRARELRIVQDSSDKFRVAVREHNQAKFEQLGGGRPRDFAGVLREIAEFAKDQLQDN